MLSERLSEESSVGRAVLTWPGEPGPDGLPLRLMGGLHALVLSGKAPALKEAYPGSEAAGEGALLWPAVEEALAEHRDFLLAFLQGPPQTNEVARSGVLLGGFQTIAAEAGLPLNLLELGASAGLNLLWDHYRYRLGEAEWGPEDAPVNLALGWVGALAADGCGAGIRARGLRPASGGSCGPERQTSTARLRVGRPVRTP